MDRISFRTVSNLLKLNDRTNPREAELSPPDSERVKRAASVGNYLEA
jgi:hypothetical protein